MSMTEGSLLSGSLELSSAAPKEGLYKVQFQTQIGSGAGVVHLMGGRMWGGDAGLYYTGSYTFAGDELTGEVTTGRHTQTPGFGSVFGKDNVHVQVRGRLTGQTLNLAGTSKEAPGVTFQAVLTRIAD
jgi:T3SS negative regulator,GrlR